MQIASVEARFTFPLPANAVVHSFQAKLGGTSLSDQSHRTRQIPQIRNQRFNQSHRGI